MLIILSTLEECPVVDSCKENYILSQEEEK